MHARQDLDGLLGSIRKNTDKSVLECRLIKSSSVWLKSRDGGRGLIASAILGTLELLETGPAGGEFAISLH